MVLQRNKHLCLHFTAQFLLVSAVGRSLLGLRLKYLSADFSRHAKPHLQELGVQTHKQQDRISSYPSKSYSFMCSQQFKLITIMSHLNILTSSELKETSFQADVNIFTVKKYTSATTVKKPS